MVTRAREKVSRHLGPVDFRGDLAVKIVRCALLGLTFLLLLGCGSKLPAAAVGGRGVRSRPHSHEEYYTTMVRLPLTARNEGVYAVLTAHVDAADTDHCDRSARAITTEAAAVLDRQGHESGAAVACYHPGDAPEDVRQRAIDTLEDVSRRNGFDFSEPPQTVALLHGDRLYRLIEYLDEIPGAAGMPAGSRTEAYLKRAFTPQKIQYAQLALAAGADLEEHQVAKAFKDYHYVNVPLLD